jgi:hypothetical protein
MNTRTSSVCPSCADFSRRRRLDITHGETVRPLSVPYKTRNLRQGLGSFIDRVERLTAARGSMRNSNMMIFMSAANALRD